MISKKMEPLVKNSSVIRAMFEEGAKMKARYGEDKVFDFSLGNPNVPAPDEVREAIMAILENENPLKVHGYMNNAGFEGTRTAIANHLNKLHKTKFSAKNLIMVVGAGSALNVSLKTMLDPGDEVLTFAPYFVEYGNYVANYDGKLVVVPPNEEDFMPDVQKMKDAITPRTKAVIINNPHNPTGVVYEEDVIKEIAAALSEKQREFKTVIYLIVDEPYRELVYVDKTVPYVTKYYDNTIVAYSYSKSLSLPGERIGYIVIPDEADKSEEFIAAATIANRVSGCVNAPSLMQLVIERCVDAEADIEFYRRNGEILYKGLTEAGFECLKPEGAFYLWMKSPVADDKKFVEEAKKYNILMVPGSSFAGPGYVRLAYCVSKETCQNSIEKFKELAKEYNL
ncbi:aspartate aminotransferase [Clostridiales bacterium S5-A14a]|nr:aspartate aminotransferase [Clostridiales bacterium S5-A14a]